MCAAPQNNADLTKLPIYRDVLEAFSKSLVAKGVPETLKSFVFNGKNYSFKPSEKIHGHFDVFFENENLTANDHSLDKEVNALSFCINYAGTRFKMEQVQALRAAAMIYHAAGREESIHIANKYKGQN